jgi:hypothetical protein
MSVMPDNESSKVYAAEDIVGAYKKNTSGDKKVTATS